MLKAARAESTCANRFCPRRDEDLSPSFAMRAGGIRDIIIILRDGLLCACDQLPRRKERGKVQAVTTVGPSEVKGVNKALLKEHLHYSSTEGVEGEVTRSRVMVSLRNSERQANKASAEQTFQWRSRGKLILVQPIY
jgi:hypothetical protein